jgi:hypothetical protein
MPETFLGLYVLLIVLAMLIAYAGFDETLRIFAYLDLQVRYLLIRMQMKQMQRKMERELKLPAKDWEDYLKNDEF